MVAEMWIDHVARSVGKPAQEVRELNMYHEGDVTHFGQALEHCRVRTCWEQVRWAAFAGCTHRAFLGMNQSACKNSGVSDSYARRLHASLFLSWINLLARMLGSQIGPSYHLGITQTCALLVQIQVLNKSQYAERQRSVNQFNCTSRYRKRGLAATPTKFGISFTTKFLNQAGALVHIYTDGTVLVTHGGVEMGQGLHTKMAQVRSLAAASC